MLDQFKATLKDHGDKLALHYQQQDYSYQWLLTHAEKLAHYLQQEGIQLLAFCLHNHPMTVLSYLAPWFADCHACPINPRLTNFEVQAIISQLKPGIIVVEQARASEEFIAHCQKSNTKVIVISDDWQNDPWWHTIEEQASLEIKQHSEANETYHLTSGTLARPKVIRHNLQQILRYAYNRANDIGFKHNDKLLISLSLNHAFAFSYQLLPALILGLPMLLVKTFCAEILLKYIKQAQVTNLALLSSMAYHLAVYAKQQQPFEHRLRYIMVAGDATSEAIQDAFQDTFNTPLYPGIGMTEVFGYAINHPDQNDLYTAGRLFKQTEAKIKPIPQEDTEQKDSIGEIYVRNEVTPLGYLNQEELNQSNLISGWLKTGDVGYIDDDGYLHFMGRKKDIIIKGGSNIMPLEVEQALYLHDNVFLAAVIGVQDDILGEQIHAYITLSDHSQSVSAEELEAHLKIYLAAYKIPDKYIFMQELPKNATGKVNRAELKKLSKAI